MKKRIFAGLLALVLGLSLGLVIAPMAETAQASGSGSSWSDNFNDNAQQTWTSVLDKGANSSATVVSNRYQLHTEYSASDGVVVSYVNSAAADCIMQAKVERIASGDKFLAYLIARGNVSANQFYCLGISSGDGTSNEPHLWLGKFDGATYTNLGGSGGSILPWGTGNYNWSDCYIKFAVFGNTLNGKVWKVGESEPGDWQVSATDNSFASGIGGVMVATYHTLGWDTVQAAFDDVSLSKLDQTEVWVDDNWAGSSAGKEVELGKLFGYNAFATIQTAIDAASTSAGDTINVAAGTYTEQILIQKSLTLQGAGEATTIIKAPTTRTGPITQGSYTYDYIVAAYPSSGTIDVRIEGFTIDANNQAETTGTSYLVGVFFRNVSGTNAGLFSCTILGFTATEYKSYGIKVDGNSILTIYDNTLSGYTRDGMEIRGSTLGNPAVTISNNDLTGSALPLQGISVIDGTTGSITGNTVRNHTRSAAWAACGILVDNSDGVYVTDNTVLNTFYAIYIGYADNCTVSGNILTDNIKRAISLDTANNNTISDNTITGPTAGTDDVGIGLDNNCANNMLGGITPAAGNIITMATSGTGNLYAIYMQALVGANNNTISYNTITGGKRAVQFDGPPGITGTTTISNNTISGQTFGGIVANNNGSLVINNNTLTNTTRPMEFWGPVNVTITGNTINGATFDGINMGNVSGTKLISENTISNINVSGMSAIHGRSDADNLVIDGNTISASYAGIWIDPGCTGVTITDNIIFDNTYSGIRAYDALLTVTGNIIDTCWRGIEINGALTAHNNSFLNNTYGSVIFYNNDAHDVTDNWWDSASGPGAFLNGVNINTYNQDLQSEYIQANTYANFTFAPWLDAAPPDGTSFAPVKIGTTGYYPSIQSAITAAAEGATINVAAGTYTENVVIPASKNLTLLGAQHDVDPNREGGRGDESILDGGSYASGKYGIAFPTNPGTIVINGFTIKNYEYGIWGRTSDTNVVGATISYNILENNGDPALPGGGASDGQWHDDGGALRIKNMDNSTISYNLVRNCERGIRLENDGTNTSNGNTISHNCVYDNQQYGIAIYDGGDNNTVEYNTVYNNPDRGIQIGYNINNTGNKVLNNTVYNNCNDGILLVCASNAEIKGNTVYHNAFTDQTRSGTYTDNGGPNSGFGYQPVHGGITINYSGTGSNITISGNNVHDNGVLPTEEWSQWNGERSNTEADGIYIGVSTTGVKVNSNSIKDNQKYGVENLNTSDQLDATLNWWGHASGPSGKGPGTGDAVSDNVLYDPWYVNVGKTLRSDYVPTGSAGIAPTEPTPTEPPPGTIDVSNVVTDEGVFVESVQIAPAGENIVIEIPAGTIGLTADNEPVTEITVVPLAEPPAPPPAGTVAFVYDLGPDGAVFDPPITLSMPLPAGEDPENAVIAYWNGSSWEELETTYDAPTGMLRAQTSHFSVFGVIVVEEEPPVTTTEPVTTTTETPPVTTTEPVTTTTTTTSTEPVTTPTTSTSTEPVTTPTTTTTTETAGEGPNWAIIGGAIGGVVVIIAIVVLLVSRRRG